MRKLAKENLESARSFVEEYGRKLDRRLLAFDLDDGSTAAVIEALGAYQNEDGGFGKALEADVRMEASSVLATTVAFQYLRRVNAPGSDPLVGAGIRYLRDTFDAQAQIWPIVPPEVDEAPHAPWWNHAGTEKAFGGFRLNPTAEVLGYLLDFPDAAPPDLLARLTETVVSRVEEIPEEMEMHELMCCIRLAETRSLPDGVKMALVPRVERAAERIVERDPEKWSGYCVKPLSLVHGPKSPLAALLAEDVQRELDYEIETQGPDGAWGPNWSWGGDAWLQAERDWKGYITVHMLRTLHAFGRL